jgi:ectoine hydroxylase-related dioxygenase (phytanoyl-CoA dioxygenase family)
MDNLKLKMAQGATRVIPYSHEYSQDEIAKLAIAEYRVNIEGVKS